jgi:hypothetical protein
VHGRSLVHTPLSAATRSSFADCARGSAARAYWETGRAGAQAAAAGKAPTPVSIPVYYNQVDRGGHFAAWEEPELFASELRAASHQLR